MSSNETKAHRRPYTFGPLYDLLIKHFPGHHSKPGQLAVQKFAGDMGYAHETIYKAIRQTGDLKIGVALSILQLSREDDDAIPLCWEDLTCFTLPEFDVYSREKATDDEMDDLLS